MKFHITGSSHERPAAERVIFCDGSGGNSFRPDQDLELSHWIPNRTPVAYKADTSTEICMHFVERHSVTGWDLAVNDHVDVDGILSVFTLIDPQLALVHRETIVQAAEMGDFWGWGERPAQILFQGLTLLTDELTQRGTDTQSVYEQSIDRIPALLTGDADGRVRDGIAHLESSVRRVERGEITRERQGEHFVHYAVPRRLVRTSPERALYVPSFNEALSDACLLWPHARARRDEACVGLVSLESDATWYYDLWYPGYMWADTPRRWRAPGLEFAGSTNGYRYGYLPLEQAVQELRERERGDGRWTLVDTLTPFSSVKGRNFPVVLSVLSEDGEPVPSFLPPEEVGARLGDAFRGGLRRECRRATAGGQDEPRA